jgi:competence protein ComEC
VTPYATVLAAGLCVGLALANAARIGSGLALVLAVALAGWWWGSSRLDQVDRSVLARHVGEAGPIRLVVTGPVRRGRYDTRAPGTALRFREDVVHESVQIELPDERGPPQGAVLEAIGELKEPGFQKTWLRRHGVHVVVRIGTWRIVGRRGGLLGLADRVHHWLRRSATRGLSGERAGIVEGVVLGDDTGLSDDVRQRFRASGLYHLLAVSGQNVALVAGSVLLLAWVLGISRFVAQLGALAAIGAYVLAVGAQPSVIRAGVAGALGSLAWLTARAADRWHFLLVGAVILLAWNPYTLLDPGFQLSFAAVTSIFVLVPRFERFLEGYPVGRPLRLVVAVSAACGLATAPIGWLHFHSMQLLTVPANVLAAPVVVPLLGLALAAALVAPVSAGAAATLAWLNGCCAAYLLAVARVIGGLPFAQITSAKSLLLFLAGAFVCAAYAWPRWRLSSSLST